MNMTLDEMKLAVCEKLPELIKIVDGNPMWIPVKEYPSRFWIINWPTEGLQVCHEAEKQIIDIGMWVNYTTRLEQIAGNEYLSNCHATYEQRLEALCRVWWPERFE